MQIRGSIAASSMVLVAAGVACQPLPAADDPADGGGGSGASLGTAGVGGLGGVPYGPLAETKDIWVACGSNLTQTYQILPWELTVDPTPIGSDEVFAAVFGGIARFDEEFLDIAQAVISGGVGEVQMLDFRATIVPFEGAAGPHAVLTHAPIEPQCGKEVSGKGRMPCDPANDIVTEVGPYANLDCEPVGIDNPCGRFIALPTSDDCSVGGTCWNVDRDEAGSACPSDDFCKDQAKTQCELNGFCITGGLEVPLSSAMQEYRADPTGEVRFGWYQPTFWQLPTSDFDEPATQLGLRFYVKRLQVAIDCVASDRLALAAPFLSDLISFPIVEPTCTDGTATCPPGFVIASDGLCILTEKGPVFTVTDPGGTGACPPPSGETLKSTLSALAPQVVDASSLFVSASVRAENVIDDDCVKSNEIIATVGFVDRRGDQVTANAIVFNQPVVVSLSEGASGIRGTDVYPVEDVVWSASPDACCERRFQTTFTVSVAQCGGFE